MTGETEPVEVHDFSRVDAFMRARRRSMLMHAAWRPMLAGAAGAALVMGCVWIVLPKVSYREVIVPAITMRDVEVPKVTTHPIDIPTPNIVARDVQIDIPVPSVTTHPIDIPVPSVTTHPVDIPIPSITTHPVEIEIPHIVEAAPLTPAEHSFIDRPEYQDAPYHGRIVASRGGGALSFADGKDFFPAHWDPVAAKAVFDPGQAFSSDEFVGEFGMCRQPPDSGGLWSCVALHNGRETPITHRRGHPA
jgi:hypothetical protein